MNVSNTIVIAHIPLSGLGWSAQLATRTSVTGSVVTGNVSGYGDESELRAKIAAKLYDVATGAMLVDFRGCDWIRQALFKSIPSTDDTVEPGQVCTKMHKMIDGLFKESRECHPIIWDADGQAVNAIFASQYVHPNDYARIVAKLGAKVTPLAAE